MVLYICTIYNYKTTVNGLELLNTVAKGCFTATPEQQISKVGVMYNLKDLLQESGNITIAVSLTDLKQFAVDIIESTKRELEDVVIADKAETYPSPKRVCEILDVDASTLWRWNKRGYLCPAEVGGKRRYKMSDVNAILNGGRAKK